MVNALGEAAYIALGKRAEPLTDDDLRAISPILILSPHPDDETLGCGGLIARTVRLGFPARVAFLTDGGASHVGSPTWPRERLAEARRQEALAALLELGAVEAEFLDWPDAEPHPPHGPAWNATLHRLAASAVRAKSVFAPWPREAHSDHQAAAALADALARRTGAARFSFVVWGWADGEIAYEPRPRRLDCPETIEPRKRAISRHRTQTVPVITDAEHGFLLPQAVLALVERPAEIFLEA